MKDKPRCVTGIERLDSELNGGVPVGNTILMCGGSGAGKTTICMQFLFNGAKIGEKGVFFTSSTPAFKLKKHLKGFTFFDEKILKEGKISIIDIWNISDQLGLHPEKYSTEEANILFEVIRDITKELGAKRLIIDSLTELCYRLQSRDMIRDFIFNLGSSLAIMKCTTFLTSEIPPKKYQYSQYGIEEFISDGIIHMGNVERKGDLIRTLQIVKMRGTTHGRRRLMMDMSPKKGVELANMLKADY